MTPQEQLIDSYFTFRCLKGMEEKGFSGKKEYEDRLAFESQVITSMGYAGYFLIVMDLLEWTRQQDILHGPGRGCFLPQTTIKCENTNKRIQDIQLGDIVISHDKTHNQVDNILSYEVDENIIEITLENGKIISCTSEHPILTSNRGWVRAEELSCIDELVEVE